MSKLENWLLSILFFELFAGGGGRLIELGPFSIRQVLFILLLVVYGYRFMTEKQVRTEFKNMIKPKNMMTIITVSLCCWIAFSGLLGFLNGHSVAETIKDGIRVSYIILIVPFWFYIKPDRFSIEKMVNILKIATIVVSVGTILIGLCGKYFFVNDFKHFYEVINNLIPADLFFRPSRGVFYKSHFLVLFGLILSSNDFINNKAKWFDMVLILLASVSIIYSETRGLYLGYLMALSAIVGVHVLNLFLTRKEKKVIVRVNRLVRPLIFYLCAFSIVPYFYFSSTQSRFNDTIDIDGNIQQHTQGNKSSKNKVNDVSVNVRVALYKESKKLIVKDKSTVILGNGYGTVIGDRTDGIEMTFLDIMVEQGFIGVLLWLAFSLLPCYYYLKFMLKNHYLDDTSIALFACVLTMIAITNINPFLNSPIGLGFLLPIIVSARRLEIKKS